MLITLLIILVVLLIVASLLAWRYYSAAKYWRDVAHTIAQKQPSLLSSVAPTIAGYIVGILVGRFIFGQSASEVPQIPNN